MTRAIKTPGATKAQETEVKTQTVDVAAQPVIHENHDTAPEGKAESVDVIPDDNQPLNQVADVGEKLLATGSTVAPENTSEILAEMKERMDRLEQENAQLKRGSASTVSSATQAHDVNPSGQERRVTVLTPNGWSKEVR
ncbi:hypothetical protein ABFO59_05200 [Acinetobacter radioresistens]|uniref:hypothetical protein n=1 Tax=Acinetobacter radioresistens TaxID=40216 RepID=UPI00321244ED